MHRGSNRIHSFPPIISQQAKLIILGSMPGVESLRQNKYYAHPRNSFWPIMLELLSTPVDTYEQCTQLLKDHGIAVWDVLQSCQRSGSLDANIQQDFMRANDFNHLFARYSGIRAVFFNGGAAEKFYKSKVLTNLEARFNHFSYQRLPSTSPAHASMTLVQKKLAWKVLRNVHKII